MEGFGKNFSAFGKNLSASFTPFAARTQQYVKEQLGQAEDKLNPITPDPAPPDYIELEKRVDALKAVHQKMLQVTSHYTHEAYDYPSNLRESFNDLGRTVAEKVQLLSSANSPAEAQAALARAALNASHVLAAEANHQGIGEDPLATGLEKFAVAAEKVGEARLNQDAQIQSRFLAGWSTTLNTNLMFATRARKSVENARLNLDATKARARGGAGFSLPGQARKEGHDDEHISEEARQEIEAAEDEFVAATEEAVGVMKNVLDTPEPLRNLAELIAAQLEYHKRAYEILSELAPVVDQLQVEQEANYRKSREGS
ncbi:BAR domain-containing protein [Coniosporium tulheliwenetii]|uniref:BAR domain-containing protein n=1 Tax=Coniosporium tulheliwenetii TaxID=3383036 RepID=A0ACC2YKZ4_9PEZI|nr:BAR domain-containing protein [Cladosporium sp. JES 115]